MSDSKDDLKRAVYEANKETDARHDRERMTVVCVMTPILFGLIWWFGSL